MKRIYNIKKTSYTFRCDFCDEMIDNVFMQNYVIEEKNKQGISIFSHVITRFGHEKCLMGNRIGKKTGTTKDKYGNVCDVYEE